MKRATLVGLQVAALLFGVLVAFASWVGHMMGPLGSSIGLVAVCSVAVMVAITAGVMVALAQKPERTNRLVLAAVVTALLGFAPQVQYAVVHISGASREREENRQFEAKVLGRLAALRQDVEARTAARRPYTPQEALDILFFVSSTNLSYRSLGNHSEPALELLRRALIEKLIDANGMVKGPRPVDVRPEPLFIHYYKAWTRPTGRTRIGAVDWKIMVLLAGHGADLTLPGAAPLAEDLRKTVTPDPTDDDYIQLR